MSSTQILLRNVIRHIIIFPFSFLSSQVSAIVGREHLSASRYLNLQGQKFLEAHNRIVTCKCQLNHTAPKFTLHIKCSILRPPKYLPTHRGSNSIRIGRSSKIALTNVILIDGALKDLACHLGEFQRTAITLSRSPQHLHRSRPGSSRSTIRYRDSP